MLSLTLLGLLVATLIIVWLDRPEPPRIYDWEAEEPDWRDEAPRWSR